MILHNMPDQKAVRCGRMLTLFVIDNVQASAKKQT